MPGIRRRKKNGKFVGNWFWGDLNLETKDPTLARERSRLAARGDWPPADSAADNVAAALSGAAERIDQNAGVPGGGGEPPPAPSPPPEPAISAPPSETPGAQPPPAWNAAAAEAAGSGVGPEAATPDAVFSAMGIDASKAYEFAAKLIVAGFTSANAMLIRARAKRQGLRADVPSPPEGFLGYTLSEVGLAAQLGVWFPNLNNELSPGLCTLAGFGTIVAWQIGNTTTTPIPEEELRREREASEP